jgi:hypothetical protein
VKEKIRKLSSGKYAARNLNNALRYFTKRENAVAFQKDATAQPRDYHGERYERRRQKFFADFAKDPKGSGWLGNISNRFPPADSSEARAIVERLKNS